MNFPPFPFMELDGNAGILGLQGIFAEKKQ
jgi:hypothetical protein